MLKKPIAGGTTAVTKLNAMKRFQNWKASTGASNVPEIFHSRRRGIKSYYYVNFQVA